MLVMVDDVQFKSRETFLKYISKALGCEEDEINSITELFEVLCDFESELEVIFYDSEEIPDEMKGFYDEVLEAFHNARAENENLTISFEKTSL